MPASGLGLAFAAFVVAAHLDAKDGGPLRNALVVVAAPAALSFLAAREWRARPARGPLAPTTATLGWAGLVFLAAIGTPSSDYPGAALRMVAYLAAWGGLFAAFRTLSLGSPRALPTAVAMSAAVALALAALQSAAFGNPFGGFLARFTSFASPQLFGLSLPLLLALLLAAARGGRLGSTVVVPLGGALLVASQMNGGRQGFVACLAMLLVAAAPAAGLALARSVRLPVAVVAAAMAISLLVRTAAPAPLRHLLEVNDIVTLLTVSERALAESGDAGTTRDRLKIWSAISARQERATTGQWILGHGTSASGAVIAQGDVRYRGYTAETMDANRTAHNEYLRSVHEWGLAGLYAFLALVITPVALAGRRFLASRRSEDLLLLSAAAGGFLGYALLGNTLAAAGGPLGIALVLLYVEACGEPSR